MIQLTLIAPNTRISGSTPDVLVSLAAVYITAPHSLRHILYNIFDFASNCVAETCIYHLPASACIQLHSLSLTDTGLDGIMQ